MMLCKVDNEYQVQRSIDFLSSALRHECVSAGRPQRYTIRLNSTEHMTSDPEMKQYNWRFPVRSLGCRGNIQQLYRQYGP